MLGYRSCQSLQRRLSRSYVVTHNIVMNFWQELTNFYLSVVYLMRCWLLKDLVILWQRKIHRIWFLSPNDFELSQIVPFMSNGWKIKRIWKLQLQKLTISPFIIPIFSPATCLPPTFRPRASRLPLSRPATSLISSLTASRSPDYRFQNLRPLIWTSATTGTTKEVSFVNFVVSDWVSHVYIITSHNFNIY